ADGVAGHHRHHRLRCAPDLDLEVEHVQATHAVLGDGVVTDVAVVAADALVTARAEGEVTLTGQDDHTDGDVVTCPVERVGQFESCLGRESVAYLGWADGDLGDALGGLVGDVPVVARRNPLDGPVAILRKLHGGDPRYRPEPCVTSWRWPCRVARPSWTRCA